MIIAQDADTPVLSGACGQFRWRATYSRSGESLQSSEPGQDFLAFEHTATSFAFVLCDGVGESFCGDLGARILGEHLLGFLRARLPSDVDEDRLAEIVTSELDALTSSATEIVRSYPLPLTDACLLGDVLREKQARGSESMFVAARVDASLPDWPAGRIVLLWMGDSRVRLFGPTVEHTAALGDTFRTAERWSTRLGPVLGSPHAFVRALDDAASESRLQRVLAYSDGLHALDALDTSPADVALTELMDQARSAAASDDMSLVELWLGPSH